MGSTTTAMPDFVADIRFALRMFRRDRAYAFSSIACLAFGIASVTAVFSLLNAVLLRPLPFPDSHELVMLRSVNSDRGLVDNSASDPDYLDWSEQATSFSGLAAYRLHRLDLADSSGFQRIKGFVVSDTFFSVLGLRPHLGAVFSRDGGAGMRREIMLGASIWRERYEARPDIVGDGIDVNSWATWPHTGSRVYTVTGVLPEGLRCLPSRAWFDPEGVTADKLLEFCLPLDVHQELDRHWRDLDVIARLREGVSVSQAQAEMDVIAARLAETFPDSNEDWGVRVVPLHEHVFGDVRPAVVTMFAAAMCVLVIACGNVSHLLLVRAQRRQAEMAIRAAVGATTRRLVGQLVAESLVLMSMGAAPGVLLATQAVDILSTFAPPGIPRLGNVSIDGRVLAFAGIVSILSMLAVSIVPIRRVITPDLNLLLNSVSRNASQGMRPTRVSNVLLIAEVALTFVLLVGAGVHGARFREVWSVDPGFNTERCLTMSLSLPQAKHEWNYNSTFCNRAMDRVRELPGVESVAVIEGLPIVGTRFDSSIIVEGKPFIGTGDLPPSMIRVISDGYFHTMGIALRRGRPFDESDSIGDIGGNRTVIINESLAQRCWPDENPIGQRIKVHRLAHWMEVVGVVADTRNAGLDHRVTSDIYYPEKLYPQPHIVLLVETKTEPMSLARTVADVVRQIDQDVSISNVQSMAELVRRSQAQRIYFLFLITGLAALALGLALGGVFMTTLYSVSRRTHEIGIRMAVGAEPLDIVVLVLQQSLILIALGIVVGLMLSIALIPSLLTDWRELRYLRQVGLVGVPICVALAAVGGCLLAARRAAFIDPMLALRRDP